MTHLLLQVHLCTLKRLKPFGTCICCCFCTPRGPCHSNEAMQHLYFGHHRLHSGISLASSANSYLFSFLPSLRSKKTKLSKCWLVWSHAIALSAMRLCCLFSAQHLPTLFLQSLTKTCQRLQPVNWSLLPCSKVSTSNKYHPPPFFPLKN